MRIDGKEIANKILLNLKRRVAELKQKDIIPHLVIILINNDPASIAYVNQKKLKGKDIGAKITIKRISQNISQSQLLQTIKQFNNNNNIHGIIIQRPLPKKIDTELISLAIDPNKDVDGFNKESKFKTPIALAVLGVLEEVHYNSSRRSPSATSEVAKASDLRLLRGGLSEWLPSQKILVIGKGETGGTPIITMFKKMGVKPTAIDSKTPNSEALTKKADIIISAVGKPDIVKPEMIKKGVILIGVGLSKGSDGKLHGDYDEEKIKNIASFYTPTPGGVGPVNVAMLLKNLIVSTEVSN